MKTAAIIAAAVMLMSSALSGQSTPSTPSFDVASIKLHADPAHEIGISTSGPRLMAKAETVLGLIVYAYDLKSNYQVAESGASGVRRQNVRHRGGSRPRPHSHESRIPPNAPISPGRSLPA